MLLDLLFVVGPFVEVRIEVLQPSLLLGLFDLQRQREVLFLGRLHNRFNSVALVSLGLMRIDSRSLFHQAHRHDEPVYVLALIQGVFRKHVLFVERGCRVHHIVVPAIAYNLVALLF